MLLVASDTCFTKENDDIKIFDGNMFTPYIFLFIEIDLFFYRCPLWQQSNSNMAIKKATTHH